MRAVLHIQNGTDAGRKVLLRRGELRVGRSWLADLACPHDAQMSEKHFRVFREGGLCFLADLASTNGSFVNGFAAAGPTRIHDGDTILAGETLFQVNIVNGRPNGPPASTTDAATSTPQTAVNTTGSRSAEFTTRPCKSGLIKCRGTCAAIPPHMLASLIADRFSTHFIVDFERTGLQPPDGEDSQWLINWVPQESRDKVSPRVLPSAQLDSTELFQKGWGKDGMVVVYCNDDTEQGDLYRQLRELAGMFVRPSLLMPQLMHTSFGVLENLFASVTAVLVEDSAATGQNTDVPPDWCIFALPEVVDQLKEFGLTESEA